MKGVTEILLREAIPLKGSLALWHQNKPGGFACVSCSYGRPPHLSAFEFCENGAKATAWEITGKQCSPSFFAEHTVTELESWSDLQLEEVGRLTEPMRWDSVSDRVSISWAEVFAAIGAELKAPNSVIFYACAELRPKRLTRSVLYVSAPGAHVRQQRRATRARRLLMPQRRADGTVGEPPALTAVNLGPPVPLTSGPFEPTRRRSCTNQS